MWIAGGANWFFGRAPEGWNPWLQFIQAGLGTYVPRFVIDLRLQANARVAESIGIKGSSQNLVISAA
jgi:hypothetical protein